MNPVMLVVDDEPLVRMDLAEMAEAAGFETVEAQSAAVALNILENRNDIRVLFTDIAMPGEMDGLALAHVVRDRWPPTVIVICSGNSQPRQDKMPKNTLFVSKPCSGPRVVSYHLTVQLVALSLIVAGPARDRT
jgi:CheY-like chemotaxis protein